MWLFCTLNANGKVKREINIGRQAFFAVIILTKDGWTILNQVANQKISHS